MSEQVQDLRVALEASVKAGVLSTPHLLELPAGFPFFAAVATTTLPPGCTPPKGPLALRVGSGVGQNRDVASLMALAEAAERYSLQYSKFRSTQLSPTSTAGGEPQAADILDLTIGAPTREGASSRGAAAGALFEQAAERALFEMLEHHHIRENGELISDFFEYASRDFGVLNRHLGYLEDQLRELKLAMHQSSHGYVVARAICRDYDGGRVTIGSAAGRTADRTVERAAEEAMLLWRNMIEIERHGLAIEKLDVRQQNKVKLYRGAARFLDNKVSQAPKPIDQTPQMHISLPDIVHQVTGRRVRVFDMTASELAVPVARVLLD